jgi:hypothetical protein
MTPCVRRPTMAAVELPTGMLFAGQGAQVGAVAAFLLAPVVHCSEGENLVWPQTVGMTQGVRTMPVVRDMFVTAKSVLHYDIEEVCPPRVLS